MNQPWLYWDTTIPGAVTIAVGVGERVQTRVQHPSVWQRSERLLEWLARDLGRAGYALADLGGLIVVTGPGGFTAVRAGVAAGNALAYVLGIPVVGVRRRAGETSDQCIRRGGRVLQRSAVGSALITPVYSGQPNITLA